MQKLKEIQSTKLERLPKEGSVNVLAAQMGAPEVAQAHVAPALLETPAVLRSGLRVHPAYHAGDVHVVGLHGLDVLRAVLRLLLVTPTS
jgi:hypothetical protein